MRSFFGEELTAADRRTLAFLIETLDSLKDGSYWSSGKPVLTDNILLLNVAELKDVTQDIAVAANCLCGVFQIMVRYWVCAELYRQLGRCFDEMEVPLPKDVTDAVRYVKDKMVFDKSFSVQHMCWQTIQSYVLKPAEVD